MKFHPLEVVMSGELRMKMHNEGACRISRRCPGAKSECFPHINPRENIRTTRKTSFAALKTFLN